ncbi:MAG TPA: GAF and ANTAR domain-containing protein [Nocardioidaceae bacterium]|nr:GAF and ANTAR domain-containing protein [Nocardioidaceae bacterium]
MTMPDDHLETVRAAVADEPAAADDGPGIVGLLSRLCRAASRDLPASGVGISLVADGGLMTAAASEAAIATVEDLQFTLGEGPCLAAFGSRRPVLVADLDEAAATIWPVYASAAGEHGVRAVFAFPLQVGVARLGALDVYRAERGALTAWTMARALTYADAATHAVLDTTDDAAELVVFADDVAESRLEVYQAQGMLTVQLGISAERALMLLRAYAFAHDRDIAEVASDVIARRLTLEHDEL